MTVTDVRGRVVYWASAGTCGFRGTRRGTPFAAQTAAGNAIRTAVGQGMQRAEVMMPWYRNPIFQGQEPRSQKTVRRSYF